MELSFPPHAGLLQGLLVPPEVFASPSAALRINAAKQSLLTLMRLLRAAYAGGHSLLRPNRQKGGSGTGNVAVVHPAHLTGTLRSWNRSPRHIGAAGHIFVWRPTHSDCRGPGHSWGGSRYYHLGGALLLPLHPQRRLSADCRSSLRGQPGLHFLLHRRAFCLGDPDSDADPHAQNPRKNRAW